MIFNQQLPLQERINFVVYALSRFILSVGKYVYLFAVSYFIMYETGSAFYFSINMAISIIVTLILLPFSGVLSDLGNKRKIVISGEILNSLVIMGLFLYTVIYDINLIAIYIVTFLTSMIEPFVSNAFQTAITELFHKDRIQQVMGYTSAILSSTVILGPILGGVLFGLLSFSQIILIFLIAFALSALLDFFLKFDLYYQEKDYEENHTEGASFETFKHDVSQGFIFIARNKVFQSLLIIAALVNFMSGVITIFPEKMMIYELAFQPETVGIVNAIAGIGVLIGGVTVARIKNLKSPFRLMKRGLFVFAGLVALYLLPLHLEVDIATLVVLLGLIGTSVAMTLQFVNIPINLFVQLVTPQHIKGRVFSTMNLCSMSIMPVGAIFYGYLYDFELYWVINVVSAILIIAIVFTIFNEKLIARSKDMYDAAKTENEAPDETVLETSDVLLDGKADPQSI
ncbi:MFS transporter [Salinicoccus sp. ID82-1]|uniref:MFS transporter n=1 Tax=Salinicoccus sp. ID82-1 TaxID=2820269 RepID=UPI001F3CDF80|nr:MFS transporter [Salinicoccus sp. ID82-1]MCG1009587.1 MFS transporter [Salinicoccus sp. ID82-1]